MLVTDLYEGGNERDRPKRAALKAAGVNVIVPLALRDERSPSFDCRVAEQLAALGIPSFACTLATFPELMAAAIQGQKVRG